MHEDLQRPNNFFGVHFLILLIEPKQLKYQNSKNRQRRYEVLFLSSLGKNPRDEFYKKATLLIELLFFNCTKQLKLQLKMKLIKNLDEIYVNAIGTVNGPFKTADIIGLDILDKMFDEILGNERTLM